jgi:hypothetical protein
MVSGVRLLSFYFCDKFLPYLTLLLHHVLGNLRRKLDHRLPQKVKCIRSKTKFRWMILVLNQNEVMSLWMIYCTILFLRYCIESLILPKRTTTRGKAVSSVLLRFIVNLEIGVDYYSETEVWGAKLSLFMN